jgi:serine phosphatase RsbU (regulator of sigma subunit)
MPGDKLMVISDGIVESQNPAGEILGQERLKQFVEGLLEETTGGPKEDQLLNWLKEWHGSDDFPDDVSILSIGRKKKC